eukprot:206904_1
MNQHSSHCCYVVVMRFKLRRYHLIITLIVIFICTSFWSINLQKLHYNENSINSIPSYNHIIQKNEQKYQINTDIYMRSYYNWIGGLGDTSLSNDDLSSNCLYPSVPFLLTHDQIFNNDILYSQDVSNEYQFSKLYNRVITIKCTKDQSVSYHQSNSIYNSNPAKIKRNHWHTLSNNNNKFDSNAYILHLANTTQTTWIRCGKHYNFHISLLPLSIINAQLYSIKTRQIAKNFKDKLPPNIVILVIDSTSRSSFMRTAHSCVDYLTSLLNNPIESPSHILQFFRYSTIGWGTAVNMNGLISGVCSHDNCGGHTNTNWSNCVGLAQYYNKLGYYVIGYNENKDNIDNNIMCKITQDICKSYLNDIYKEFNINNKDKNKIIPQFDCIYLGMGPDGHTASLFPAHKLLQSKNLVDFIVNSPKPPPFRITFTLPLICNAKNIVFVVTGASKQDAIKQITEIWKSNDENVKQKLPSGMVTENAIGNVVWMLDDKASATAKL